MKKDLKNLPELEKKFGKVFFLSVSIVFGFFIILRLFFKNSGVIIPTKILLFGFFLTLYTAYLLSKTNYDFVKLFRIITFFLSLFITYVSLLISDISKAIEILFVPLVLMIMLFTNFTKTVMWTAAFIIFSFFSSEIASYFQLSIRKNYFEDKPHVLLFQEYIIITISAYFSFIIIYYNNSFRKIEAQHSTYNDFSARTAQEEDDSLNNLDLYGSKITNLQKDQLLYYKIIQLFDEEKPYQNEDFNIRKLAELLDSNSTYVSRALNKVGNKKFNQLVNDYRINQVKEEIANNLHQKFTLEHIYTSAGFSQQSTFNRIFKENTGYTPSDYIENLQRDNKA